MQSPALSTVAWQHEVSICKDVEISASQKQF